MGNINIPIPLGRTTKHSRRFLECFDNNFLLKEIEEPARRNAILNLVLINKEELAGNVKQPRLQ